MDPHYKIGMRTIKTTISVFLCLLIGFIFQRDAFYSSIAAVMCLQPTIDKTLEAGLNRTIGTVIGGAAGFIVLEMAARMSHYYEWSYLLIVPLFILFLIFICNAFRINGAISMCTIVFIGIAIDFGVDIGGAFFYVINRIIDTTIGIVIAMVINRFIAPAKKKSDRPEDPVAQQEGDDMGHLDCGNGDDGSTECSGPR